MSFVENIHQIILKVYPFLTKIEKDNFEKKSQIILDKFKRNELEVESAIKNLLNLFNGNIHADIKEWHRLTRNHICELKIKQMPSLKIEDKILYIKIPSWGRWLGEIDKKLNKFCQNNIDKYNAIIIDVRENQGGASSIAHNFASIFFQKIIVYGKFIKKKENGKLATSLGKLIPNKKIFINKPIAILISKKCFSSNELFLAPFKISKRAVLVGESTGGGSANPTSEVIKISGKKFVVRIPTWRFFLKGKSQPVEKTKISPDIFYKGRNIEGFAKNYLIKKSNVN